jgi:hypothetical protein
MAPRKKTTVVSKQILHRKCDVTDEDIAKAPPVKMPQITPEQHREQMRGMKRAATENKGTSNEGEKRED